MQIRREREEPLRVHAPPSWKFLNKKSFEHPLIFSVTFKLDSALKLYFHFHFPSLPPSLQWEELLSHDPLQKSLISEVYKEILSFDCSPVTKVKAAWEQELGLHLGDDWWETALKKIDTSSACARLTLIQFKVLFSVHFKLEDYDRNLFGMRRDALKQTSVPSVFTVGPFPDDKQASASNAPPAAKRTRLQVRLS